MARRQYVSFLGERRRDITFGTRGPNPGRWVLVGVVLTTIAISIWWFGFRDVDQVAASERVLNETSVPTLLEPSVLEGSGAPDTEVSLDCPTLVEEWTMFQGGVERTGCLTTVPIVNPEIKWIAPIGLTGWRNNPVIDDGAVFVGSAGVVQFTADRRDGIYSLDLKTGKQRWLFTTELDVNSVAVSNGVVVGVGDEGRVWALRARDGGRLWEDDLDVGVFGDPIFVDDIVIITDGSGTVTAYNVAAGTEAGNEPVWAAKLEGAIRGGASSDGELIYVASDLGQVVALTKSGERVWEVTLTPRPGSGDSVKVFAAPTVTDTLVILSIVRDDVYADPGLRALDKETGEELWASVDTAGIKREWANIRSSPAIAGDYVVFGEGYSDALIVADLVTGNTIWSVQTGDQCFSHWPSPVINNGVAYLARHDGGLYAVDLQTREQVWSIYLGEAEGTGAFPADFDDAGTCGSEAGHSILSSPAVASSGMIVVGTLEGFVMAIGDADWEN